VKIFVRRIKSLPQFAGCFVLPATYLSGPRKKQKGLRKCRERSNALWKNCNARAAVQKEDVFSVKKTAKWQGAPLKREWISAESALNTLVPN